jgi:hypothetical protein
MPQGNIEQLRFSYSIRGSVKEPETLLDAFIYENGDDIEQFVARLFVQFEIGKRREWTLMDPPARIRFAIHDHSSRAAQHVIGPIYQVLAEKIE